MDWKVDPCIREVVEALQDDVINLTRDNFLLWMFIAQEGYFEEGFDFVKENRSNPSPFKTVINLGVLQKLLLHDCREVLNERKNLDSESSL